MTIKWFTCKQPAGSAQCGTRFHPDDVENFKEHLEAHGVVLATDWWDEEMGSSLSPDDRIKPTPVLPSQFGDGSDPDRRRNAREFVKLRALEATSQHDTPAWKFEGARVEPRAKPAVVQPPKEGLSAGKPATAVARGGGSVDLAGGLRESKSLVSSRKEQNMTTATRTSKPKTDDTRFAGLPIIDLSVNSAKAARRVCVTTGRGYTDATAIQTLLETLQKENPATVIVNQGRWEGDQLVGNIAQSMGLGYEAKMPKFLEARRRGMPVIDQNERMTPEQNREFGYIELQHRLAETCTELHVFGTPSGPQRGLQEAFNEVDKKCFSWGSSTD